MGGGFAARAGGCVNLMKKGSSMKKIVTMIVSLALALCLMTGCAEITLGTVELKHYDTFSNAEQDYNRNLFYRNDLETLGADPSVIYVEEGEEAGWFYMYATSDDIGASGYQAWRSKNLTDWECTGVAFRPDGEAWCRSSLWAPECIYDKADQTYYLFFNAVNSIGVAGKKTHSMGVATSKHPAGPFELWTGEVPAGTYADGTAYEAYTVTDKTPLFDFTKMPATHPLYDGVVKAIDASPFIDDNGDRYLFFCHDLGGGGNTHYNTSEIWGMKMIDWHTPDYSTVARLTRNGKTKVDGGDDIREGNVNEAPFVIKHNGKYYLTFSVYSYPDKLYQVRQAVSDTPLGVYTKVAVQDGGTVIAAEPASDFMSGTGHHSFVTAGDENFIVYHAHTNRTTGGSARAMAADRYGFANNGSIDVIHANGPTYNLQALPAVSSGYRNIAPDATVTATNTAEGSDAKYINDGLIHASDTDVVKEFVAGTGTATITLSFDDYVTARAIMIYNSYYYDSAFVKIDKIEMRFTADGKPGTAYIADLGFDWDRLMSSEYMNIGGAAIAEFDEIKVNSITVTVTCPQGAESVAIGEIVVLGK